ncbi:sensor histidine kinase [Fibrella sp. WM1]|uniref:sensor histidine kinase n=1 Tax=Fibrella musci TaxID=3242485 RepID=UPI0035214D23
MEYGLSDVVLLIIVGTLLLLLLGAFITVLLFVYKRRYVEHQAELTHLYEAHQREILTAQLETQNQTLQHIGDELHDHIGQMLSVIWLHLNLLEDETANSPVQGKVSELLTHTATVVADVRNLSKSLSTDTVARFGLLECIRLELDRIDRAAGQQRTQFQVLGDAYALKGDSEIVLLRMVQEALNNALKHAPYAPIHLTLNYQPDALQLTIADEGPGFSMPEVNSRSLGKGGQGLHNLRRRAQLLGGSCVWHTAPGEGTQVVLTIPRSS